MQQQNKNNFMGFDTIEINLVNLVEDFNDFNDFDNSFCVHKFNDIDSSMTKRLDRLFGTSGRRYSRSPFGG